MSVCSYPVRPIPHPWATPTISQLRVNVLFLMKMIAYLMENKSHKNVSNEDTFLTYFALSPLVSFQVTCSSCPALHLNTTRLSTSMLANSTWSRLSSSCSCASAAIVFHPCNIIVDQCNVRHIKLGSNGDSSRSAYSVLDRFINTVEVRAAKSHHGDKKGYYSPF